MKKIFDKFDNESLLGFRDAVASAVRESSPHFSGDLSEVHRFISQDQVNAVRLSGFMKLNTVVPWEKMVLSLCEDELRYELGSDILVQSKINISIQMPHDKSSILPSHSDSWSAETPFQLNIWIPLTDAFDTNAMFLLGPEASLEAMLRIANQDQKRSFDVSSITAAPSDFVNMKFGQVLLFNPAALHGNVENLTTKTRVSLNLRVKSMFAPEPSDRNPDRRYGTFYKSLLISENTKFALDFLKTGILS